MGSPRLQEYVRPRVGANLQTQRSPGAFRLRGLIAVGARRALLPIHTLGALALAGCVLPDATLRGMRMFRSHGGTVPAVSGRELLSEASSLGSVAPCRERRAGRGADTPAILVLSRRHRYHGDGASFWLAVGPALRV